MPEVMAKRKRRNMTRARQLRTDVILLTASAFDAPEI
jgi:hypothetical protein